jgi:type IV secretory pathway VirD2 relaxase
VKVWTTTKIGTTAAHTCSIAQAGKSIDGGYADLFTAEDRVVDRQGCAQRSQDDPHQFRMIISLVEGAPLDLQAYTRAYMAQMARDVGGTLEWMAATHQDTAHVQTPVMIRGRDLAGRDLYPTKHYWA